MFAAFLVTFSSLALATDGLVVTKSAHSVAVTMDRVETLAKQRNFAVIARINFAAGAARIGKALRPTELLIFGNPQAGAAFMQCAQTAAIDLPLKVLIWEDESAQVWLGYNDPEYLARRHGVAQCSVVNNIHKELADLAEAALVP